jgi:hypothetical protein
MLEIIFERSNERMCLFSMKVVILTKAVSIYSPFEFFQTEIEAKVAPLVFFLQMG